MWNSNPNIENLRKIRDWLVTLRQEIASSTVAENDFSKIDNIIDNRQHYRRSKTDRCHRPCSERRNQDYRSRSLEKIRIALARGGVIGHFMASVRRGGSGSKPISTSPIAGSAALDRIARVSDHSSLTLFKMSPRYHASAAAYKISKSCTSRPSPNSVRRQGRRRLFEPSGQPLQYGSAPATYALCVADASSQYARTN